MDIPQRQAANNAILAGSPKRSDHYRFLLPSPIPTRRSRTYSQSERAKEGPVFKGIVEEFCRQKGHGFIKPFDEKDSEHLFVHISDVEGEYVPKAEDHVTYRKCLIPPQNTKYQAVHVSITHLGKGVPHEKWDSPASSPRS